MKGFIKYSFVIVILIFLNNCSEKSVIVTYDKDYKELIVKDKWTFKNK